MDLKQIADNLRPQWELIGLKKRETSKVELETSLLECFDLIRWGQYKHITWFKGPKEGFSYLNSGGCKEGKEKIRKLAGWCFSLGKFTSHIRNLWMQKNGIRGITNILPVRFSPWQGLQRQASSIINNQIHEYTNTLLNCLFRHELSIEAFRNEPLFSLAPVIRFTKSCAFWIPLGDEIIVADAPIESHFQSGRMHKDGGPAVAFGDNTCFYALNGVIVPEDIANTPRNALDPHIIFETNNAEIRREIIRKIGIERVCEKLGARCIDKCGDYELLELNLRDGFRRPYLKMLNPSIGTYHVEGVHPRIRTVNQALRWRNGTKEVPVIIS